MKRATAFDAAVRFQVRQAAMKGSIFLPDCSGRLAPSVSCIQCGKGVRTSRLLARIDPSKVRRAADATMQGTANSRRQVGCDRAWPPCVFCLILCLAQVRLVYPMVPDRICSILGVPSLEAIAMEQLDQSVPLRQLQDIQVVTVGRGAMGWLARFILTACNDRGRGRTLRQ